MILDVKRTLKKDIKNNPEWNQPKFKKFINQNIAKYVKDYDQLDRTPGEVARFMIEDFFLR